MSQETHVHTCPLCEATCGLSIEIDPGERTVLKVRGDDQDVFSRGFACPKGLSIGEVHADPDRLRTPLVDGQPATWDEAWQAIADRLMPVIEAHGRQAMGIYLGNPNVHNLAGAFYTPALAKALGTTNVFSASTVDQQPKHVSAALMFGHKLSIPVPDVDRTDYFLILGADPLTSNGSLFTAPDMPGRLRALSQRGGRLVVVDPRVSRTAKAADEHLAIRPGTDALWLAAIANELLTSGAATPVDADGLDLLPDALAPFTPETVADATRIPADVTRRIAAELAAAPSAAVYGRMGTSTQRFGTTTSWLVDVINILTGNLDRPGGAMFAKAVAGQVNSASTKKARKTEFGRFSSSVRNLPEMFSELPSAALAEEMLEGPIRGMITVAGNPALSVPNAERVTEGLAGLDVMISIDMFLNETTRHADVVLPVPSVLEREHMDLAFAQLAVRNVANWSDPVFDAPDTQPSEWEIQCRLMGILQGMGPDADVAAVDAFIIGTLIQKEVAAAASPIAGRDSGEILAALGERVGTERIADFLIRVGPYGDGFGADPEGLTLDTVQASPHGIDLGALEPRLPEVLLTPTRRVDAAPSHVIDDLPRLAAALDEPTDGLLLVGRRHLRSNNSWGHNIAGLVGGTNVSTLQIHPSDAEASGVVDGGAATVTSANGSVTATVEVTPKVSAGTVSLPHGWGHDQPGTRLSVASSVAGTNPNVLTGPEVDPLSGNAVLNGVPVTVSAAEVAALA